MQFALAWLVGCFAGSAGVMAMLNWLGSRKWRAARNEHWAERARLLYPVRMSAIVNLLLVSGAAMLGALGDRETRELWVWAGVVSFAGGILGCYPLDRHLVPEFTFRSWLSQSAISWGTRAFVLAPFIIAMVLAPPDWNGRLAMVAIGFGLWHTWSSLGGVIDVWQSVGILKPVPAGVSNLLKDSFNRLKVTPKRLLWFRSPLLLAFAMPFRKTVIFSEGLLEKCSASELNAICLHELAHLTEDRRILMQRALSGFALYPFVFLRPAMASWGVQGFIPIYVAVFGLLFCAKRVGRKAEARADLIAAKSEFDEGLYARALQKLYEFNQAPAVMPGKRQLHPHLYDRMTAAGVTPDFPRPTAPAMLNWTVVLAISLFVVLGIRAELGR